MHKLTTISVIEPQETVSYRQKNILHQNLRLSSKFQIAVSWFLISSEAGGNNSSSFVVFHNLSYPLHLASFAPIILADTWADFKVRTKLGQGKVQSCDETWLNKNKSILIASITSFNSSRKVSNRERCNRKDSHQNKMAEQEDKAVGCLSFCWTKTCQGLRWVWNDLKKPHLLPVKIVFMLQSISLVTETFELCLGFAD